MSGQSSALSLKEAKAMQERVQASGSQAKSKGNRTSSGESLHKKQPKKAEC